MTTEEHEAGRMWHTPTGQPCPRTQHVDGHVDGEGECHGCGFCLLLAGLIEIAADPPAP